MNPSISSPILTIATPANGLRWLAAASGAVGVAWNLFGIAQWVRSLVADSQSLLAGGLTRVQAERVLALPGWMTVVFAIGVFAGLAGSAALAGRHRAAPALLGLSLAAYTVLFAGDAAFGIFSVMPLQLAVLMLVVLIAVGLLVVARKAQAAGTLR